MYKIDTTHYINNQQIEIDGYIYTRAVVFGEDIMSKHKDIIKHL